MLFKRTRWYRGGTRLTSVNNCANAALLASYLSRCKMIGNFRRVYIGRVYLRVCDPLRPGKKRYGKVREKKKTKVQHYTTTCCVLKPNRIRRRR